jgi:ferredoxin
MKERFILRFPPECSEKPLTYYLIKDYDVKVNILRAEITPGKEGRLLIEVEAEENNLKQGLHYLKEELVSVNPLSREITINREECVHCGLCTAVCFSGALEMDRESWELRFNPERCVACELCIQACPLRLINLHFMGELVS